MADRTQVPLLGQDRAELSSLVESLGERPYRVKQLLDALYRQRVESIEQISTLSQPVRQNMLETGVSIGLPEIEQRFVSQDGTVRYLIAFADGQSVETVWMPEGDGGEAGDGSEAGDLAERFAENPGGSAEEAQVASKRHPSQTQSQNQGRSTICISSQVGCAVNCQFCLTALLGVKRNLTAGEIVGQVIAVLRERDVSPPQDRVNLVFMGMGEPFLNFENFIKAVRLLAKGVGIPEARMTVSTAGIVPRIYDLGEATVRPKLAISLNAPNDELRTQLMPINKKWNLDHLMTAAREFPLRNREKLTFEYVLLRNTNDSAQHARELAELVRGIKAKINLIALNPGPGVAFQTPTDESVLTFQRILTEAGVPAFIRRPRGRDIYAACGQLKRTLEITT